MPGSITVNLEAPIRRALSDEDRRCVGMTLFHVSGSGTQVELNTIQIKEGVQYDTKELSKAIGNLATEHAGGVQGRQQYRLVITFSDGGTTEQPFGILGETDLAGGINSEAPTGVGHLTQMMRHNEALFRSAVTNNDIVLQRAIQLMSMQMEMNVKLMGENGEMLTVVKELVMKDADRAEERAEKALKRKQMAEIIAQGTKMLPGVINHLSGGKLIPPASEDTMILDAIADNITAEQVGTLMGMLKPEQLALIMPRLERRAQQKAAENEAKEAEEASKSVDTALAKTEVHDGTIEPEPGAE